MRRRLNRRATAKPDDAPPPPPDTPPGGYAPTPAIASAAVDAAETALAALDPDVVVTSWRARRRPNLTAGNTDPGPVITADTLTAEAGR